MGTRLVSWDTDTNVFPPTVQAAVDTRAQARGDLRYKPAASIDQPVMITVDHKIHASGYPYAVIRARTSGRFIPGLVDKRYGGDFDVTNPASTGTAFRPQGEKLDSYAKRTGATVVTNASGWNVTNNVNEMRGAQIRNGVAYHDFEATNLNGSPAGVEAIALMADGKMRCFSALRGDTAASMVAAGAIHSWSYGPNLVINGSPQDLTQKNWQYFNTEVTARTIIGQSLTGDIIVITTVGKSGVTGIAGNAMVALAQLEGCYNASLFDGGGSTQAYVQGLYTIPSSDDATGYDGTIGRRKVGDCFMFSGALGTNKVDTGWRDIPLRSGYVAFSATTIPQIRQLDGQIELQGSIKPASGNFATTDQVVADLPSQFRTAQQTKFFDGRGPASLRRKLQIGTDFSVNVVGGTDAPSYLSLNDIRFMADS